MPPAFLLLAVIVVVTLTFSVRPLVRLPASLNVFWPTTPVMVDVSRLERVSIALFILVALCVGAGGALSSLVPGAPLLADGRALVSCAVGPFIALTWRPPAAAVDGDAVGRAAGLGIGVISTVLVLIGLCAQVVALVTLSEVGAPATVGLPLPVWLPRGLVASADVLAVVTAAVAARASHQLTRSAPSTLAAERQRLATGAALALALAGLLGLLDTLWPVLPDTTSPLAGTWAAPLAVAVAWSTAARLAEAPLVARDRRGLLMVGALLLALLPASAAILAVSAVVATAGVRTLVASRPAWALRPGGADQALPVEVPVGATTAAQGIAGVAPLLDTALLRRPQRPRVLTRTSARRILDAAIDRAWRAQPAQGQRRPPIELTLTDDADVDADPGELAEALCSVLDNAFRRHGPDTEGSVEISLRSAPHTVSFEIADGGPRGPLPAPFTVDADVLVYNGPRPGYGVGLTRARVLIERQGGQLHLHAEGGRVHISLPRRTGRGFVGLA